MLQTTEPTQLEQQEVDVILAAAATLPPSSYVRGLVSQFLETVGRVEVAVVEVDRDLTPNDVATLLQVSHPHVLKLINVGALQSHPVGKHHRIKYSDYLDYIERRNQASADVAHAIAGGKRAPKAVVSDAAFAELDQL